MFEGNGDVEIPVQKKNDRDYRKWWGSQSCSFPEIEQQKRGF